MQRLKRNIFRALVLFSFWGSFVMFLVDDGLQVFVRRGSGWWSLQWWMGSFSGHGNGGHQSTGKEIPIGNCKGKSWTKSLIWKQLEYNSYIIKSASLALSLIV